jgi:uncharacterized protein (DUF1800 family)
LILKYKEEGAQISENSLNKHISDKQASRFLSQAGFGGREDYINNLKKLGYKEWINNQFSNAPKPYRHKFASQLRSKDYSSYMHTNSISNIMWQSILTGDDVLQQRVTLALSEIFVVNSENCISVKTRPLFMAHFMDLLQKHAFGNFYDLLFDVTLSVPLGDMLGMLVNLKGNAQGRRPDENFAREVMQLFTIGLYELNLDGSHKLDANGELIDTYNNETVRNLARVFTGWTATYKTEQSNKPMYLVEENHSLLEKSFLGVTIPAGTHGLESLQIALKTLFNHPNVGPFIGKQLIQRFVCSNPSPEYIMRVANAFNGVNGEKRGELKNVI